MKIYYSERRSRQYARKIAYDLVENMRKYKNGRNDDIRYLHLVCARLKGRRSSRGY